MVIKKPVTQYYHREEKPKQLSVALVPAARVAELQQERPAAACSPCSAPASLRRWTSSPSRERDEKQNPVSSRLRLFFFLWHHKVPLHKKPASSHFIPRAHLQVEWLVLTESYRYQHWLQDNYFLACSACHLMTWNIAFPQNMVQHRLTVKLPWFHMHVCHSGLVCRTNPLGVASLKVRQIKVTEQCLQHPLLQSFISYGLPYYKYTIIVIILWIYKMTFASQPQFSNWRAQTSLTWSTERYSTPKCRALLWFIKV